MNKQNNFYYSHTDHARVLNDVRKEHLAEIKMDHCYFVGFRIARNSGYQYCHSLLLADDIESFFKGVDSERNSILDKQSMLFSKDIELVFVRSLKLYDQKIFNPDQNNRIRTQVQEATQKRDDNRFVVMGLVGEDVYIDQKISPDARSAIKLSRGISAADSLKNFQLLEVCQAHPVSKEFDALFLTTAYRTELLLSSVQEEILYKH